MITAFNTVILPAGTNSIIIFNKEYFKNGNGSFSIPDECMGALEKKNPSGRPLYRNGFGPREFCQLMCPSIDGQPIIDFDEMSLSSLATGSVPGGTFNGLYAIPLRLVAAAVIAGLVPLQNSIKQGTTAQRGAAKFSTFYNHDVGRLQDATGLTLKCTRTSGSANVTTASTANLVVGATVSGTGIPANATVASITNGTTFVLSTAATANGGSMLSFAWWRDSRTGQVA